MTLAWCSSRKADSLFRTRQWQIPGQRVDLIVAGVVLIELKAIPKLRKIHHQQVVAVFNERQSSR